MTVLKNLSNDTLKSKKTTIGTHGKGVIYIPRSTYKQAREGKTTQSVKVSMPIENIENFVYDTINDREEARHTYLVYLLTPIGWRSSGHIIRGKRPNFSRTLNGNSFELKEDETIDDITVYAFKVVSF